MYMLTEWLLSFNWQRFTLHNNEKRNLELYRKIPSSTNLLNYPCSSIILIGNCSDWKSKMSATVAILKICFELFLLNWKASWCIGSIKLTCSNYNPGVKNGPNPGEQYRAILAHLFCKPVFYHVLTFSLHGKVKSRKFPAANTNFNLAYSLTHGWVWNQTSVIYPTSAKCKNFWQLKKNLFIIFESHMQKSMINVLCTPKFLTKLHMQTLHTQIRLLLKALKWAVWSGSTLFAIPLNILRNNCIKSKKKSLDICSNNQGPVVQN